MSTESKLFPLLNSIVKDNQTFKFPIECISKELVAMFLNKEEFDYFMVQAYRKLKSEYGSTMAHIFTTTMEMKLKLRERDIYSLSFDEYTEEMDETLLSLDNLYITKIDKRSPDGEMMSVMI